MAQQAICIIRGFNKSEQDFLDWEQRFAPLRVAFEKYGILVQGIYSTPDSNPNIPQNLSTPITVVQAESNTAAHPSWSKALNIPIQQLLHIIPETEYEHVAVIPMSFETQLDEHYAELLAKTISEHKRFVACRITPDWLNIDNPYSVKSESDILQRWEYVKTNIQNESLSNILRDEKRLQTLCMFGRNTLAQYYLSDFKTHGLFDETTDAIGGMEDWEYLLRTAPQFDCAIYYTDIRIQENEKDIEAIRKQREKLSREISALKQIIEKKL
ncbi:MAG: hypothetical protein K8Q97_02110 [Candidatus Andersenbacteria bacterium]|nr:hypothetical protein [Candidatus Andersenbacteria bacterium]